MMHHRPALGIGLLIAGCAMLTLSDALTKLLTASLSVPQVLFYKSLLIAGVFVAMAPAIGAGRVFRVVDWRGQLLRASLSAASTFLFVFGLNVLPFSTAVFLTFSSPLYVTALAPWLLGEHVDGRRWAAVLVGFLGVAIIARPAAGDFSWFVLLPLAAALCSSLRELLTRRLTAHDSTESMMFYSLITVVAASFALTWDDLGGVGSGNLALLLFASAANAAALYLMIESVRNAEAATVAPFRYTNLLWVTLLEIAVFGQFPRWNVLVGAVVIVASMLYLFSVARGPRGGA
jgi:drug/metabolite transporter (DMT)-like permease